MRIKKQFQGTVAVYYAPYIVNSDPSGMDPAEVADADEWYLNLQEHAGKHAFSVAFSEDEDPYYGVDEVTGLYGQVVSYTYTVYEEREYLPDPPATININ